MTRWLSPYIAATGFAGAAQVKRAEYLCRGRLPRGWRFAVGVYTTFDSVHGRVERPEVVPPIVVAPQILAAAEGLRLVSYLGRDERRLRDEVIGLLAVFDAARVVPDAIQLNQLRQLVPDDLRWVRDRLRERGSPGRLVIQLDPGLLACRERLPDLLGPCAEADAATEVLVDSSCGTGDPYLLEQTAEVLEIVDRCCPSWGKGVAGGNGPRTMERAAPLVRRYGRLSFDGTTRLRPPGSDWLSPEYIAEYVSATALVVA